MRRHSNRHSVSTLTVDSQEMGLSLSPTAGVAGRLRELPFEHSDKICCAAEEQVQSLNRREAET